MFPLFITGLNETRIRVDYKQPDKYEFFLSFANWVTDRFVYQFPSEQSHRDEVQRGNISRMEAIDLFEKQMAVPARIAIQ